MNNAFLHGDLHEEVYIVPPQGLTTGCDNMVCKLKKSLYGLKQASSQWYEKLADSLCSRGYQHSDSDYSLFFKKRGSSLVFVAIYVDDIIMTGNNVDEIISLKSFHFFKEFSA